MTMPRATRPNIVWAIHDDAIWQLPPNVFGSEHVPKPLFLHIRHLAPKLI